MTLQIFMGLLQNYGVAYLKGLSIKLVVYLYNQIMSFIINCFLNHVWYVASCEAYYDTLFILRNDI